MAMITKPVETILAGHGWITSELEWDPALPVQVTARFMCPVDHEFKTWIWSLDSLRIGARTVFPHQVGRGDVRISTDGPDVIVSLHSPECDAVVCLNYAQVREFLDAVTLENLHEAEAMDALVDAFLSVLNQESF